MDKLRVCLIFGGRSGEHEISLLSARSVLAALNPEKYEVIQAGITPEGAWLVGDNLLDNFEAKKYESLIHAILIPDPTRVGLYTITDTLQEIKLSLLSQFDVVFPILHGTFGEDGTIQGLFEMANLAYVGAGVLGSAAGMDKGLFKDVMRTNNIPVLDSCVVLRSEIETDIEVVLERAEKISQYPLFVKPANLGSSVGVSKCRSRSDLLEGLMEAARYDRRILIERGLDAREIEVSVLGNENPRASIPGEIIPADEFYSYNAKYHDDRSQLLIPAPISTDLVELVQDLAIKAYKAVDCSGMARADFLLEKSSGTLFLNEINTIPGFTQISMYPKLWEASGVTYPELVDRLINLALERKQDRDRTKRKYEKM